MHFSFSQELVSLCMDCTHEPNCVLTTTGKAKLSCEEYAPSAINKKTRIAKKSVQVTTSFAGLCGHCDFARRCSLREPESVIFNCEHYQ